MRIGTTPTHTFTLPTEIAEIVEKVRVVYAQCGEVILCKDVTRLDGNDVTYKLTQDETLKFHGKKPISIQLKLLTNTNDLLTSNIITQMPYECLECEVL